MEEKSEASSSYFEEAVTEWRRSLYVYYQEQYGKDEFPYPADCETALMSIPSIARVLRQGGQYTLLAEGLLCLDDIIIKITENKLRKAAILLEESTKLLHKAPLYLPAPLRAKMVHAIRACYSQLEIVSQYAYRLLYLEIEGHRVYVVRYT